MGHLKSKAPFSYIKICDYIDTHISILVSKDLCNRKCSGYLEK